MTDKLCRMEQGKYIYLDIDGLLAIEHIVTPGEISSHAYLHRMGSFVVFISENLVGCVYLQCEPKVLETHNKKNIKMEFNYSLSLNDFLQYQLYTASKSKRVKIQNRKSLLLLSVILIGTCFLPYHHKNYIGTSISIILIPVSLILYSIYLRYHYRKHYEKFIKDVYKNKVGKMALIVFLEDHIETSDETGESKINNSNLEEINETGEYLFLKLKTGESIIFPKSKIENLDLLRTELSRISNAYHLNSNVDLNWKW
jgi:hypothetical protein